MRASNWLLPVAVFAVLAGPGTGRALADGQKDELAEGEWEGKGEFHSTPVSGGASFADPDPSPEEEEPTGTPTPPPNGGDPDTTPFGPSDPDATPGGDPYPGEDPPTPPPCPPTGVSMPCPARWEVEIEAPPPELLDKETMLTLILFRTDAYGFVCNLYARAESTWYVDWFATTAANHSGQSKFSVVLKIVGACPNCNPHIDVEGISTLETKAQTKALFGGVDSDTAASASASTKWAAPVDCGSSCSASAQNATAQSKYGVEFAGLELSNTATKSYVFAIALGGKADTQTVKASETRVSVLNQGSVATYAAGANDNAQAKSRAGYWLNLKGKSDCGPWGEYKVELQN